jgi:predicted TIM-barrel fold metal-dependent hydrolase
MIFKELTSIPVIDSHVHVFPERLSNAVRRWFDTHAWKFKYNGTSEEMIQLLFDQGIAGLFLLTYAHRPGMADHLNEFIANLVTRFPHTIGFATLHPEDPRPTEIIRRAFKDLGLFGLKIHCHVQRIAPDDPVLFPVYEALLEYDRVLVLHGGRGPSNPAYGYDVSAISGVSRVEKVLKRYPDLKIIIPHLGLDESEEFYSLLDRYSNLYLDTAMICYFFDFPKDKNWDKLILYADRILFGTDYPSIPYEMERELRAILDLNLGDKSLRKILFENAMKLFPIPMSSWLPK